MFRGYWHNGLGDSPSSPDDYEIFSSVTEAQKILTDRHDGVDPRTGRAVRSVGMHCNIVLHIKNDKGVWVPYAVVKMSKKGKAVTNKI